MPKVEAATALVNKRPRVVAAPAGIEKVMTTHTVRHSFADRGRRLGLPAADIRNQKAVGIYARVLPAVKQS